MQYITLFVAFTFLLSCKTDLSPQPAEPDEDVNAVVIRLSHQIEENLQAENHEASIQDFITLLDYTQQLPSGSPSRVEASLLLVHFANRIGLYTQGIELIDDVLTDLKADTSAAAIYAKERLYSARASCYFELRQYDQARKSFLEELYYQDLRYPGTEHASINNNIGMSFQLEGRIDSAMYYFRKVESMLGKPKSIPLFGDFNNDEIFFGSVKDNIASILVYQGQYDDAEILYRENFSMYRKYAQHPRRLVNAGLQLARLQLVTGQSTEERKTIHVLDSLFKVLSYPEKREQELDFYQILAQFYQQSGSQHHVIQFQQAYMNLADSFYTAQIELTKLGSEKLIQYKANQFKQELEHEKREALLNRQKAQFRFWILVLFIFLSITGALFLTISLRQRLRLARKKAELNEAERKLSAAHAKAVEQEKALLDVALQHKSKDISDLALNALIKKEWAEKLDGLLSNAEQSRGHLRSIALRKLREEIRSHIHADHRISQLHENIETLNAEFYDHLNSRNPDLSKTEVRLVSFLKLRMSNDEIAMLQGISTKSVIMSRYRLRKKLSLPESADLDTFCQQL